MEPSAAHGLDDPRKTREGSAGIRWGRQIDSASARLAEPAGLSLLFMRGTRPAARDIAALAEAGGFALSHRPEAAAGWLELLVAGLTFDVTGLAPAAAAPAPLRRHPVGLDGPELPADLEAIRLVPGAHLAGGAALPPVVRAMTALAATLAGLGGVRAVCWHPAGSCIETTLFVRMIGGWLGGRGFPSHGLTPLAREPDGSMRSHGLAFFIGQELWLQSGTDETPADTAKLASRLIHRLVEEGAIRSVTELVGPDGARLDAHPSSDGRILRVWRRD